MSFAGFADTTRSRRGNDAVEGKLAEGKAPFDAREFRRTMGRFATGVTVVTMMDRDGEAYGVTVNAFMSVSLDPPLIAVSLGKSARAHPTLAASDRFAVSVLGEDQCDISDRFAGRGTSTVDDPFDELAGFPVIRDAIAHIVCRSHSRFDAGDHTIFIGEVEALRAEAGDPLLFCQGSYAGLGVRRSAAD